MESKRGREVKQSGSFLFLKTSTVALSITSNTVHVQSHNTYAPTRVDIQYTHEKWTKTKLSNDGPNLKGVHQTM